MSLIEQISRCDARCVSLDTISKFGNLCKNIFNAILNFCLSIPTHKYLTWMLWIFLVKMFNYIPFSGSWLTFLVNTCNKQTRKVMNKIIIFYFSKLVNSKLIQFLYVRFIVTFGEFFKTKGLHLSVRALSNTARKKTELIFHWYLEPVATTCRAHRHPALPWRCQMYFKDLHNGI